jgi:hypothetical protein
MWLLTSIRIGWRVFGVGSVVNVDGLLAIFKASLALEVSAMYSFNKSFLFSQSVTLHIVSVDAVWASESVFPCLLDQPRHLGNPIDSINWIEISKCRESALS